MQTRYRILVVALCALTLSACADDTIISKDPVVEVVIPKPGSTFTTVYPNFFSEDTIVTEVAENGISHMGKTNVTKVIIDGDRTVYWAFESNGDLSIFTQGQDEWYTLPYGLRRTINYPIDTAHQTGGFTTWKSIERYAGTQNYVVNGKTVEGVKIEQLEIYQWQTDEGFISTPDTNSITTIWAPQIGHWISYRAASSSGGPPTGADLIDFELK
jgi:hypothetical protein